MAAKREMVWRGLERGRVEVRRVVARSGESFDVQLAVGAAVEGGARHGGVVVGAEGVRVMVILWRRGGRWGGEG